jgi:pilus assembly protein CpaB
LRRTSRIVLLLGIFLAALTFIVILFLNVGGGGTSNNPAASVPPSELATVLATKDIPFGTLVTSDMVTSQVLSVSNRNAGALGDPSQAVGQTARKDITSGEQITAQDFLAGAGTISVPEGKRAFAIQVNELTGVGNLLNPGDSVDVIISLSGGAFPVVQVLADGSITVVSGLNPLSVKLPLLLEDVQILDTIDQAAPAPAAAQGGVAASTAPTLTGANKLLVLAVTPQQAEALLFARTSGTLDVVLRSPKDEGKTVATDGVILKTLIDKYGVLTPQLIQAILPTPKP